MLRIVCLLFAALVCVVTPARAETYRLQYEAAVLGVVVLGTASYEVTANATRYGVRGRLQTSGAARIFDQTTVDATTSGAVSGANLTWSRYDLTHAYGHKARRVQLTHAGAAVTPTVTPRYGNMGTPPATAAQQNASVDPLTAIFQLGRQIGTARACTGSVLVFDGRGHYRLSVTPKAQGTFTGGGYNGPSVTCNFRYEPLAGFTLSAQERSRIPQAEAIFALPATPGFAAPLRLSVPTPVGQAQLDLRGYQQLPN